VFTGGSRSNKAGVETVGFHSSFTVELLVSGSMFLLLCNTGRVTNPGTDTFFKIPTYLLGKVDARVD